MDNWHTNVVLDSHSLRNLPTLPIVVLGILTAVYGGLHASAWNGNFPTTIEARLWKVSPLVITGAGVAFAIYITILEYLDYAQAEFRDKFEAFMIIF